VVGKVNIKKQSEYGLSVFDQDFIINSTRHVKVS